MRLRRRVYKAAGAGSVEQHAKLRLPVVGSEAPAGTVPGRKKYYSERLNSQWEVRARSGREATIRRHDAL
jgi:hypothetical protein